jgi:hypothetical protein
MPEVIDYITNKHNILDLILFPCVPLRPALPDFVGELSTADRTATNPPPSIGYALYTSTQSLYHSEPATMGEYPVVEEISFATPPLGGDEEMEEYCKIHPK